MQNFLYFAVFLFFSVAVCAGNPDYRPKFDKSSYLGTLWTQVNPWWSPAKQRNDDLGGPNYARKKHSTDAWGSAAADSYSYGQLNWQVELHVKSPGYANHMKSMMRQAKKLNVGVKFSIFLVYYGPKNIEKDIKATVNQLNMLKNELKNDPAIFRIDCAPVISVYTPGYFKPEEWGRVISAVEAECGKFIWLLNTCRNPAADADAKNGTQWVSKYIPYFDGVSQYGNYTITSQARHDKWLSEFMHKEYPHKILELCCQNTYSNHFHFGGAPTKLSDKWRKSFDSVMAAKPDSIVLTNFFDHYENSLILPCYEREDFLLRYAEKRIADWRKKTFRMKKSPELVVNNYVSVLLGQQALDFEVVGFPIDSPHKKVTLLLDICDTAGKILHTFPAQEMDLSDLRTAVFSLPSEKFSKERGVVPRLRYKWNGRDYKMNYNPMTLISPSIRTYWMFWSRSNHNALICNVKSPDWYLNGAKQGSTVQYKNDGLASFRAAVEPTYGQSPRQGWSSMRIMRNGLEFYAHTERNGNMNITRAMQIPSPGDALNYYHMELENGNGYRYQTLPVWVTNNRRSGFVKMPILCQDGIREVEVDCAAVPYFYYPCDRDDGAILLDQSGYMHNGSVNGSGYGGGHLGNTGYYHYHNGALNASKKSIFKQDADGLGHLTFKGKEYVVIMGGTAFPGASTYEISVRPSAIGKQMGIIGTANNQINLSVESDGRLKLARGSEREGAGGAAAPRRFIAEVFSQTKLEVGKWYKIAVVYDLKTLKLYVNGKLEAQKNVPPSRGHNSINHVTVGSLCGWVFAPRKHFAGDIREIRFYGRNLNPKEFLK